MNDFLYEHRKTVTYAALRVVRGAHLFLPGRAMGLLRR